MRAIELTAYGETSGLRAVETVEPAGPAADEVLIEMEYAPVHQTDLFVIRGAFAVHPDLPSPIGNEGVGRVAAVGSGVTNVKVGDRVLPPLYSLTWREKLVVKAAGLTALPEAVDAQQLATLRINPVTAALLLSEYVPLKKNDWVLQNAGNSGVGLAVSAIAKSRGFNVISLVRSADRIPDALLTGADAAFVDDESAAAKSPTLPRVRLCGSGLTLLAERRQVGLWDCCRPVQRLLVTG